MSRITNTSLDDIIEQIISIEKNTADNVLIISDLSKFIFTNNLSYKDLLWFLENLIDIFLNKNKTIIFPAFINPSLNKNTINLDILKSNVGILSEIFRTLPGVKRTINPYFSYSIIGKEQGNFIKINSKYEWSEDSHLGWMEKNNISSIILGTFPENNPLAHRMEFKNKDIIKYREMKKFKNKIIYEKQKIEHIQYYFDLKKGYKYIEYKNLFCKNSDLNVEFCFIKNLSIYHYKARVFLDLVDKEIQNNIIFQNGKNTNP